MKEIRIMEFSPAVWEREALANYTNEQLLDIYNEGTYQAVYTLDEFLTMCNDADSISESFFFKVELDSEYEAETWTVTAGDFDEYDTSALSKEQINKMIDSVAHLVGNNECVSDCYWMTVKLVAEECGLKKKDWALLEKELLDSKFVKATYDSCPHNYYTFEEAVAEVVTLWQCGTEDAQSYFDREQLWCEEMRNLLQ